MKTLKSFLEVYKPKSPDEQKFVDKHVTIKHKDRNEVNGKANEDDVFNASNIKPVDRKANRQGYDVGEDEKVYEEVEKLDELSRKTLGSAGSKALRKGLETGSEKHYKYANLASAKLYPKQYEKSPLKAKVPANEEVELDEAALKQAEDRHFEKQSPKMQTAINLHLRKGKGYQDAVAAARRHVKEDVEELDIESMNEQELLDFALGILEKTLTPAELKKREEIAKAMERENPGMSMSKKMAIATAQAKKVAEEVEEIDEISGALATRYLQKKRERDYDTSADGTYSKMKKPQSLNRIHRDIKSTVRALRIIERPSKTNEEVEEIEESAKVVDHLIKRYGDNVRKSHVMSAANDFGVGYTGLARMVRKRLGVTRLEEEVEDLDEGLMHDRYLRSHGKKARGAGSWVFTTKQYGSPKEKDMHFTSSSKSLSDAHKEAAAKLGTKNLYVMEEVEQIDELSIKTLEKYKNAARNDAYIAYHGDDDNRRLLKRTKGIKTATKKIRSNFVKGVDEAFEQIDEAINFTALDAVTKGHDGKSYSAMFDAHGSSIHNKIKAVRAERDNQPGKTSHATFLHDKMLKAYASWYKNKKDVKEEAEVPFEGPYKKTGTVRKDEYGNVIQNVPRHLANKAMKSLKKEDIIDRAFDRYIPEQYKFTPVERLLNRLNGLSEAHVDVVLNLFNSLNEENQMVVLEQANTAEGVNRLLDFAIQNRGE